MMLLDEIEVLPWLTIHFVENNGMAFGIEIFGKLFLSLFRIIAIGYLFYFINGMVKKKVKPVIHIAFSLILAGAIGNMVDSAFYGYIFEHSMGQISTFMPEDGGYAPILYGKVVDMIHLNLIEGYYPTWLPFYGGDYFSHFRPVFNLADSAISIGVFILILYNKSLSLAFQPLPKKSTNTDSEVNQEIA